MSFSTLVLRGLLALSSVALVLMAIRAPLPILIKLPAVILVGFLIRLMWNSTKEEAAEDLVEKGMLVLQKGDRVEAIGILETALAKDPRNPIAIFRLLSNYHAAGMASQAEALIDSANGITIPEQYFEEFEFLVQSYREADFEKGDYGYRLYLKTSDPVS